MKLTDALDRAIATAHVGELLAEWNQPENRLILASFLHTFLESNDKKGKLKLTELAVLCVICILAGQFMALPDEGAMEPSEDE